MKIRPFEIGVLAGFGALFIVALFSVQFFNFTGDAEEEQVGVVEIWGTIPQDVMVPVISSLSSDDKNFNQVRYTQVDERTFDDELVNAIAEQRGPDAILIPHTRLVEHIAKISPITYEFFPARDFKSQYIDGAELYMLPDGVVGYPVAIDPLVMYWNRDIFTSNGFATAPVTWEEVVNQIVPTIVRRDFNRNILLSPIALGEYRNITNAFEIISALILQGGSPVVSLSNDASRFSVVLNQSPGSSVPNPGGNAVEFYTSFATVNNPLYSWNRAQPQDKNMFASGDVAIYLGMGSEYAELARLNPNLNFDIAELPQSAQASVKRTYGDIYAISLLKSTDNVAGSVRVMNALAFNPQYASAIAAAGDFAPAHRSLLAAGTNNPIAKVRYVAALYSRGWYNPEKSAVDGVLQEMVEAVLSGRTPASGAVNDAMVRLGQLF